MILTPIAFDRLPEALNRFALGLEEEWTRRIFDRIAVPEAAQRASEACAEAHRRAALRLADGFGMGVLPGSPQLDFGWNGEALRSDTEAYVLLHEVAHFQLATPERRKRIDFGLGAGPESGDRAAADAAACVFGLDREREESRASLLGILWEVELGQPALASFLDQNWLEGVGRRSTTAHFETVLATLREEGFIGAEGRPTRRVR
jgi:hypothetical protein